MTRYSDEAWLALCLASESNRPNEWPALAWVIRNRVESGRYPDSYVDVILQPKQFSYFNELQSLPPDDAFRAAMDDYPGSLQPDAMSCAAWIIRAPAWERPFSSGVLYFWAPGAMVPAGSDPSWASDLDVFTLPGNPRWRFAE